MYVVSDGGAACASTGKNIASTSRPAKRIDLIIYRLSVHRATCFLIPQKAVYF